MNAMNLTRGAALALAMAMATAAPARAEEPKWTSLFDGKTLSGWTVGGNPASKWEVVDGEIRGSGPASMLYSPKKYKNFRLKAEVKISDKANSGLYFRSPTNTGNFSDGYECQINSTHTDPIRNGSLYGFVHIYRDIVKPDTWFTYEIECIDGEWRGRKAPHIRVKIDGEELYMFMDFAQTWKDGHFAFQQHDPGSKVAIRKVEVQELP
jgi:hypothetical protein